MQPRALQTPLRVTLLGALSLLSACGDTSSDPEPDAGMASPSDSGTSTDTGPTTTNDVDGDVVGADSGTGETDAVYVFGSQIIMGSSQTSYLVLTDTLSPVAPLDTDGALEVTGRALVAGTGNGYVYVGSNAGPTVTRYELSGDGNSFITPGTEVSFANEGVSSIGEYQEQFQFISDTKAYYFDAETTQVIVWNPTAMTVTQTLPFSDAAIAGATLTFGNAPIRDGDMLFVPLGWRTGPTNVNPIAGVIAIDTESDTLTYATDDRCGYVRDGVVGADGMIYLATEAFGAAAYHVNSMAAPAPCLLRFDPETLAFDADFFVALETLTGSTAGTLLPAGQGSAWLRVLDTSLTEVTPETAPRLLASLPVWRWWEVELGDTPTASVADGLEPGVGSSFLIKLGDAALIPAIRSDRSNTDMRSFADGMPNNSITLSAPGLVFSGVRVR